MLVDGLLKTLCWSLTHRPVTCIVQRLISTEWTRHLRPAAAGGGGSGSSGGVGRLLVRWWWWWWRYTRRTTTHTHTHTHDTRVNINVCGFTHPKPMSASSHFTDADNCTKFCRQSVQRFCVRSKFVPSQWHEVSLLTQCCATALPVTSDHQDWPARHHSLLTPDTDQWPTKKDKSSSDSSGI